MKRLINLSSVLAILLFSSVSQAQELHQKEGPQAFIDIDRVLKGYDKFDFYSELIKRIEKKKAEMISDLKKTELGEEEAEWLAKELKVDVLFANYHIRRECCIDLHAIVPWLKDTGKYCQVRINSGVAKKGIQEGEIDITDIVIRRLNEIYEKALIHF
jgi:Skp family chaperone for outer membrane proteins